MKISAFLLLCCLLCGNLEAQPENSSFFQSTENGERTLQNFYKVTQKFRENNDGKYLSNQQPLISELTKNHKLYGYENIESAINDFVSPDNSQAEDKLFSETGLKIISVRTISARPNGSAIGSSLMTGEEDIIAYTNIYARDNVSGIERNAVFNPSGYYLTLDTSGQIKRVPYDTVLWSREDGGVAVNFWGQAGLKHDILLDEELKFYVYNRPAGAGKPVSAGRVFVDNGGPESLVPLSRRVSFPNRYGVPREILWRTFSSNQTEFSLEEVRVGAEKIGLNLQVRDLNLTGVQQKNSAVLLFLKDDGRIVTLTALDEDRAVIVDRGLTRNVERSVLEKRYSGEALIPTKALTQNAGIIADDAVRSLELPSQETEVPQQFLLRNTGDRPVTLQLEYPLLGATEAKLSKDTLAPGETATLDLKVKWRSILKAPTQNVLVSLQTSDPIVPRLQIAILLKAPAVAQNLALNQLAPSTNRLRWEPQGRLTGIWRGGSGLTVGLAGEDLRQ